MSEMQCEICGADIPGAPTKVVVDGSALEVCKSCARFGTPEDKWAPVTRKIIPVERAFRVKRPKPRDQFRDLVEIIPDYGEAIKKARTEKDLSLEELALKIKEKASLLRKIERQELVPEDEIRKKLEEELNIKLTDQVSEERWRPGLGGRGLTLGDIASIKRR
jgi:putative transcription factor